MSNKGIESFEYDRNPFRVRIDENGVGRCVTDECYQYDGKRCQMLGFRPGEICEPWVWKMLEEAKRR